LDWPGKQCQSMKIIAGKLGDGMEWTPWLRQQQKRDSCG
jgi:hypothetical protein